MSQTLRPSIEVNGVPCFACTCPDHRGLRFLPVEHFQPLASGRSVTGRNSWCRKCQSRSRTRLREWHRVHDRSVCA